jgi:predicted short-subunit dehydrogenase-like oxidoreductase (DUF2520 family)
MTQRSGAERAAATGPVPGHDRLFRDPPEPDALSGPIAVVGQGRLGSVLATALAETGLPVSGPHGRGYPAGAGGQPASIVLLCVPDAAISLAAAAIAPGPLVAHCSGATGLDAIAPHRGFSLHPVMTFTPETTSAVFDGIGAAVAGTDPGALGVARRLAVRLGMRPFVVADKDRTAYHAATAMAANFLVTLESAAGRLMQSAGVDARELLPLAMAALQNWGRHGAAALTGPVARGDQVTVDAHRAAVTERAADLLPLFDAMVSATAELAGTNDTISTTRNLT